MKTPLDPHQKKSISTPTQKLNEGKNDESMDKEEQ